MNAPLISVVVTTYNRAHLLPRAIDSVLKQNLPTFELIVVDDGSTDETHNVVDGFTDPRVSYEYQDNAGLSAARNTGFARSSGLYVTFLDDDDEVEPTWLASLATMIVRSQPAVVSCGAAYLDEDGRVFRIRLPERVGSLHGTQRALFRTGTYAIRSDVFEAVGGYATGARRSQNTELSMRLLPLCAENGWEISAVDEALLKAHRHRPENGYYAGKLIGAKYILEAHRERLKRNPRHHANYLAITGVSCARIGDFSQARKYHFEAIRTDPRRLRNYLHLVLAWFPPVARLVWAARNKRHARAKLR